METNIVTESKDPVCGMAVDESSATAKADFKGEHYYFCSTGCKEKFEAKPEFYLKGGKSSCSCCGN